MRRRFHVKRETPQGLTFLDDALAAAARDDLLRVRAPPRTKGPSFCSNDYLGLGERPAPAGSCGAGASRLVCGEHASHVALEEACAAWVGAPAALAFTSGYAANVGLVSALAGPEDLVVSDALNHASIIDGCRLSRARVAVVPHCDAAAVERALGAHRAGQRFVVTESYFSMDADAPDLAALRRICDAAGAALLVDEAHALGVLGPDGRGLCVEAGITPDALAGTLGKAFGAGGAFVAGCPALVSWLWNRARSFVFSTGLSPVVAEAGRAGLRAARAEPELRIRLLANAERFRRGLLDAGIRAAGFGPIIPWIVGDVARALRIADGLREAGVDVRAIRPPTVPAGTARLRFTVTAAMEPGAIDQAVATIARVARRHDPTA
jgi:8-amino-7-oxononanoate synthase